MQTLYHFPGGTVELHCHDGVEDQLFTIWDKNSYAEYQAARSPDNRGMLRECCACFFRSELPDLVTALIRMAKASPIDE